MSKQDKPQQEQPASNEPKIMTRANVLKQHVEKTEAVEKGKIIIKPTNDNRKGLS